VKLESAIIGRPQQIRRKPPLKCTLADEEKYRNLVYCAIIGRRCVKGGRSFLVCNCVCPTSAHRAALPFGI
jgi:hypothetical protein